MDREHPRPNWSGFMQYFSAPVDDFLPPSDIRMLPIIDLNPNDLSCIYLSLRLIENEAQKLNMPTACVTFDQGIVESTKMNVVCRLGGFHCIMNFLGSIGHIMQGSGLVEALQCSYGPVAVSHMMTGKAVARTIRGHFLVESAIFSLIMESILDSSADDDAVLFSQ